MNNFYKYHALGNDYIVIDTTKIKFNPSTENIKLICNRSTGIGADGVLLGPFIGENKNIFEVKVFNSDGTQAEVSGNGIRIFAKYLLDNGYAKDKQISVKTLSGISTITVLDEAAKYIQADMGKFSFTSKDIPAKGPVREVVSEMVEINSNPYSVTCVNVGNPHCVVLNDELSKTEFLKIAPALENHYLFPQKINVQFVKVLDKEHIKIKIWERGCGYTLASGTSACAAAAVTKRLGLISNKINVEMPGGSVEVEINNDGHIFLTGPVENICSGSFLPDLNKKLT